MTPNAKMKAAIAAWVTSMPDGKNTFRPMLMDPKDDISFCALGEGMCQSDSDMITGSIVDLLEQMVDATLPESDPQPEQKP